MSKCWVRVIGDIHSHLLAYQRAIKDAPYSIQLGDLSVEGYSFLDQVDSAHHRFVPGNHEIYESLQNVPHALKNFGLWMIPDFGEVFYVQGAWSIDRKRRPFDVNLQHEELTMDQCEEALQFYGQVRPKMVVSHACPQEIAELVSDSDIARHFGYEGTVKTRTGMLLQAMADFHRPKVHVFGHYHRHFDQVINGTRYICLPPLRYRDFPKNFVNDLP